MCVSVTEDKMKTCCVMEKQLIYMVQERGNGTWK